MTSIGKSTTPSFNASGRKKRGGYIPFNRNGNTMYPSKRPVTKEDYEFDFVGGCGFHRACGFNYWPWFKNTKYKGAQTLAMLNILASWWHFMLAIAIILVSVLNSDPITDGVNLKSPIVRGLGIGSLIFSSVAATFFAFYIYHVIKAQDVVELHLVSESGSSITPEHKRTIQCCTCFLTNKKKKELKNSNRNAKCIFIWIPLNMDEISHFFSIFLWVFIAVSFIGGFICTYQNIEGSYPVVLSSSITALDKIPPPFDSPYCDGKKYTDALKWIKCINENEQNINRTLYDQITGKIIPWRDAAGDTCEMLLKDKNDNNKAKCTGADSNSALRYPPTVGWTSDEACVGCALDSIGGESCSSRGGYSCVFNSTLVKYEALSGSENDPTRIIPRPTFKIYTGTDEHPLFAWGFIFAFSLITSIFHCFLGTMAYYHKKTDAPCGVTPLYVYMISNGRSPLRWLEYSITSAIMFTLVLTVNRVTDVFIVTFAFIISVLYNTFGAAIDYIDNSVIVIWMWTVSFIGFIAQFICLFIHFDLAIAPYIDPEITKSSDLWGQFFDIIRIINWGLLLSFSTFPIVSLFHQCYKYKCWPCKTWIKFKSDENVDKNRIRNCMTRAEMSYIWLSFISKTLLVVTMLLGTALRRNNSSED